MEINETKVWNYEEKAGKTTTHHTITVNKQRFTHETHVKEGSKNMRARTDVSLKNIYSVNTFYGLSRNITGAIICFLLSALSLIALIALDVGGRALFLIPMIVFAGIGVLIIMKIKPAFMLEINSVIPMGQLDSTCLAYGSVNSSSKKRHGLFYFILSPIIGIFKSLSGIKGRKYVFAMAPEVGNEIVDTIGALLIEN